MKIQISQRLIFFFFMLFVINNSYAQNKNDTIKKPVKPFTIPPVPPIVIKIPTGSGGGTDYIITRSDENKKAENIKTDKNLEMKKNRNNN